MFNLLIKSFLFFITIEYSQSSDFNWFGNLRYRILQDKETNSIGNVSSSSEMRSRLGLIFNKKNISASFVLQDSKTIGGLSNFSGVTSPPPGPFLYEVYFKANNSKELLQFGRFEMALGNQRILSKNNWNNVGRTFEGVLLTEKRYKHAEIKVFSVGLNESKNTYHDDSKDTWLNGAYINYKIPTLEKSVFDIYTINFRNPLKADQYSIYGGRTDANFNTINLESEFAIQSGDSISSSLLSINVSWLPKNTSFLNKITLGYDNISENDNTTLVKEGFSKYFGARHKFHGFYDYKDHKKFMDNLHDGLNEINVKFNLNFLNKSNLLIAIHNFKNGKNTITYGNEIDFIIKRKISESLSFESGLIFYKPENETETLPFSYLALTASI